MTDDFDSDISRIPPLILHGVKSATFGLILAYEALTHLKSEIHTGSGNDRPISYSNLVSVTPPTVRIRGYIIAPKKSHENVFNLPDCAKTLHQKYIRGWVLG